MTSVGPGSSIHLMCNSVIASTSISRMDNSARELIFIRFSANRDTDTKASSSTPTPDLLFATSIPR